MKKIIEEHRTCTTCKRKLIGRIDKVYCSIECKNEHHRIAKIQTFEIQKYRNKRIKRNYIILEGIFRKNSKKILIHRNLLFEYGYDIEAFLKKVNGYLEILEYKIKIRYNGILEISRNYIDSKKEYFSIFTERWKRAFPDQFYLEMKKYEGGIMKFFETKSYFEGLKLTDKRFDNNPLE